MATEVHLTQAVSPFLVNSSDDKRVVQVEGFAVHCGTFNNVTITKQELEKGAHSIVGAPIIKAHDAFGNPEDVVIGKVSYAECKEDNSNGLYGLFYKAEIDAEETELIRKMNLGFISSTSIGFRSEHICSLCGRDIWDPDCEHWFWDDGFQILATDIDIHELSVVAVPADREASVQVTFSKETFEAFEKLPLEKESRRTKMSDFEKKYNDVVDEFSKFKMESADELNKIKEEFSQKKEELELEAAEQTKEVLSLKNDIESLTQEKLSLEEEVGKYKEAFAKMEEDKLNELRTELTALNKDVNGGLKEERIAEMSESGLKEFIEVFSHQKENMITLSSNNKFNDKYESKSNIDDNATPLDQLAQRLNLKL